MPDLSWVVHARAVRIARDFDAPAVEEVEADVAALLSESRAKGLLGEETP